MDLTDLPTYVPTFAPPTVPDDPGPSIAGRSNAFVAGVKSGGYGLLGAASGALSGAAKIVGADTASSNAQDWASRFANDAAVVGRPDIEKEGWLDGVGAFGRKLAYSAGQAVPGLLAAGGAAAVAPAALGLGAGGAAAAALEGGEALTGGAGLAARAGSILPKFLGGGTDLAAARSAAGVGGAAAVMIPQSFGEQVNERAAQPGGLTRGGALQAALQAVPAGLAQSLVPSGKIPGLGIFGEKAVGRILDHGINNAAAGAIGSAAQTAADLSADPTMTASDKFSKILSAAGSGAVAGGLFGGAFGLFGKKTPREYADYTDQQLKAAQLDPQDPSAREPQTSIAPAPNPPTPPVQGELRFNAPPSVLPEQTQLGFDVNRNRLDLPNIPYDPGRAPPPRSRADAIAEVKAAREAANPPAPAAAPPETLPTARDLLRAPDAPPDNALALKVVADAKLSLGRRPSDFKTLIANSTSKDYPSFYNELAAVPADSAIGKDPNYLRLIRKLGIDEPDLEGKLAKATTPAEQKAVKAQILLRDQAAALRSPEQAPTSEVDAAAPSSSPSPGELPGAAAPALTQAVAAPEGVDIPDIPEHATPADALATKAVPDADAPAAAERASDAIQTAGPEIPAPQPDLVAPGGSERTPAVEAVRPDGQAAGASPLSIKDQVLAAARETVGDKGGEVDVATLRTLLPNLHADDINTALRDIHADDSDSALVQNPKGQRTGVDGVSVPGSGKFHKLDLEPRTPDAEVGGAAAQAGGDQPGGPAADGGTDAAGAQVTRAGDVLEGTPQGEGQQDQRTPGQGDATAPEEVAPAAAPDPVQAAATQAKLAPQDTTTPASVPKAAQTAAKTAATESILTAPSAAKAPGTAGKAVVQRLRKQARSSTAMLDTPQGDQVPTAAVGGELSDLAQATATSVDPVQPAATAEPIAVTPWDRGQGVQDEHPVLPSDQVKAHFDKFVGKLKPEIQGKIHLVDSYEGLPADVRTAAEAFGHDLSVTAGLYDSRTGEVYLRGDMMRNPGEIEDVLSHEVFGHLATAKQFDGYTARQSALSGVFDRAGGRDGIEKLARDAGVWSDTDDGHALNGGTGLKDYLPPAGTELTPGLKAMIVDELIAHKAGATPADSVIANIQASLRRAIVNTLRRAGLSNFAKRMDRFGQPELAKWLADNRAALRDPPRPGDIDLQAGSSAPRTFIHDSDPTGDPPFMARMSSLQKGAEGVMSLVGSLRDKIQETGAYEKAFGAPVAPGTKAPLAREMVAEAGRAFLRNIAPADAIVNYARSIGLGSLIDHFHAMEQQNAIGNRIDGVGNAVAQRHLDLQIKDPVQAKRLNRIMDTATAQNLDPLKPFEQHDWLHDGTRTPDQIEALRATHADLQKDFRALGQPGKGDVRTQGQQVYRDQVAMGQMNWYMARAVHMHDVLSTIFKDKVDAGYDPTKRFAGLDDSFRDPATQRQLAEDHFGNVNTSLAYWKGEFDRLNQASREHLVGEGTRPENDGTQPYNDLGQLVADNQTGEAGHILQGPYFRRGRQGDYAVSMRLNGIPDEDGQMGKSPDPAALAALQAHVDKNFPQLSVGRSVDNRSFFARFPSQEIANQFANSLRDPKLAQHIEEGSTRAALLSHSDVSGATVPFLHSMVGNVSAKFEADLAKMPEGPQKQALAAERDKVIGNLRASIMDLSGDNSMRSIQSSRENVQGSSTDMLQNQKDAAAVFSRSAAQTSVRQAKADALAEARGVIDSSARSGSQDALNDAARKQRVLDAYNDRNEAADVRVDSSFLSWAKRSLHTYSLGASPAYFIMNLAQVPTLGLPELGKFHGFARSTQALVKALGPAGRVVASMVKQGGLGMEGGITKAVLDNAGMDNRTRNYLSTLVNHDHLELGSYTSANSGLGVGNLSTAGRWLHYVNSTALLSETYARLVMAFAAKDLHDTISEGAAKDSLRRQFPTAEDYAGHVIPETMLRWGSYNTPKLFTAGGALGKAGPLVTQFHGFVPRLVGKLYQEAANGYLNGIPDGPNAAAMRAEARRFTLSHLATVATMSGGLGLPFAGYAAALATRGSGLVGDQPYDVEAHLRNALADTFGPDVGEILTRGLPRYLGADMSELGDDNFAPLSRLMEDRRKLEDAFPAYMAHAWGSAPSAALNMVLGVREMAEGRFMEAGARSLPTALRNVVRAYKVSQQGYTNASGEKLPIPAGAAEVLKTALGVTGGDVAEERERQESLAGLKDDRAYRSGNIKRNYILAYSKGDQDGMASAMDAARRYDQDNPGYRLTSQLGSVLASRAKAEAFSRQTGTLGVNPADRVARALVNH